MNIHSLARLILMATVKLRTPTNYGWRSLALAAVLICSARPTTAAAAASTTDFPVWIELDKPQLVTIVIEDAAKGLPALGTNTFGRKIVGGFP